MWSNEACKPLYEVLVDNVHQKKGSSNVSSLGSHCRFNGANTGASFPPDPCKAWTMGYSTSEVQTLGYEVSYD